LWLSDVPSLLYIGFWWLETPEKALENSRLHAYPTTNSNARRGATRRTKALPPLHLDY
jgi:hypothetical protein